MKIAFFLFLFSGLNLSIYSYETIFELMKISDNYLIDKYQDIDLLRGVESIEVTKSPDFTNIYYHYYRGLCWTKINNQNSDDVSGKCRFSKGVTL